MLYASTRALVAALILFLSQLGNPSANYLAAQVVKIDGPEDTASWAFHETGRIFAAVKSTNSVVEYDAKGKEVRSYDVETEPTEMIVKGDRLVVACPKTSSFSVIDLSNNSVAGKVTLSGKGPRALFCSEVNNGIVYGVCQDGSSSRDSKLFQVDINNLKVLNKLPIGSWRKKPYHVAMSADGKWIVADQRSSGSSPTGAALLQVDEATCTFTSIKDHHSSFGQILAGPANRYWMFGGSLYPLNIESPVREFGGNPVAIHSQLDLAVAYSTEELKFFKFSNSKLIKPLKLSFSKETAEKSSKRRSRSRSKYSKEDVLIGFGSKRPSVVVASGSICQILDLKKLEIPFDPLLLMNVPSSVEAKVNDEISVPFSVTNNSLNRKVAYEIKNGPEGARISGNKLVWEPTAKDIGRHSIVVAAKVGEKVDETTIQLNVKSEKTELDFNVVGMDVEEQGKFAIAWGKKIPKGRQQGLQGRPSDSPSDEVAVIDLATNKVVIQKTLSAGIKSAIIQGPYVFLMPRSGNVLYRMDLKSLEGSKRVFLKEAGISVFPFPGGQIAYTIGSSNKTLTVVDSETLKTIQTMVIPYTGLNNQAAATLVAPGAVELNSKIVSEDDGSLMMLKTNPGFPLLGKPSNRGDFNSSHMMREMSAKMFGRHIGNSNIASSSGSLVAQIRNRRLYPCSLYHVAFAIGADTKQNGSSTETNLTLETISLVDGAVLDSRVFDSTVSRQRNSGFPFRGNNFAKLFFTLKDKAIFARDNQIFVIPLDEKILSSAPEPLHFPVSKLPMLGTKGSQKIDLKAVGGTGKLDYQLVSEYDGISVNAKTGMVKIDTPALWKNYLQGQTPGGMGSMHRDFHRNSRNSRKLTDSQIEDLLGEPLPEGKIALALPIQMAVTDEEAQEDRINVFAIVLGDKTAVDKIEAKNKSAAEKANAKRAAQREMQMEEQKMRAESARAARAAKAEKRQAEAGGLDSKRLDDLEKRLKRIEASVGSILLKLEGMKE